MAVMAQEAAQFAVAVVHLSLAIACIAGAAWAWVALFLWAKRDWQKLKAPAPVERPVKSRWAA